MFARFPLFKVLFDAHFFVSFFFCVFLLKLKGIIRFQKYFKKHLENEI